MRWAQPYAEWLSQQDRWDEAVSAFHRAGRSDMSTKLLQLLAHNAVVERRFKDASYYLLRMSQEEMGRAVATGGAAREHLDRFHELSHRAEVYYCYAFISEVCVCVCGVCGCVGMHFRIFCSLCVRVCALLFACLRVVCVCVGLWVFVCVRACAYVCPVRTFALHHCLNCVRGR